MSHLSVTVFNSDAVHGLALRRGPGKRTFEEVTIVLMSDSEAMSVGPSVQKVVRPVEMPEEKDCKETNDKRKCYDDEFNH
jgi:hypothetical protein